MRALTQEFGILLIFDEVKTGFRFARGGAAEFFGIKPDLATYAKAMGNGYPAAAFGGRAEVMSVLPDKVSHGGTYAGNRVAAAAAVKTLSIIKDTDALETIHATGRRIQDGLREILNPTGLPYHFTGHPSMFGIMFREEEASEYRDWATTDHELYDAIAIGMHARGAMPEPDSREPWFICEAHAGGDTVDRIVSIFADSLDAALEARAHGGPAPAAARRHGRTPARRGTARTMVLDGNAVRSVDRAAALLLALGDSQGEAGVTELARRLGLHKSTASRLLATLQKRGLVEQDGETGKYRLGLVVIRLAERAERTLDLRGISLPELERLARLTHETTGLGILEGDSMLAVAQADGPNLIAVGDWTGRATPLHCVASGKVLLAALAEREVLRIVRRGLVSYTERTITELEPLLEELARIRRRGYATAIGEYELGLNAVAAPVHDARGNVDRRRRHLGPGLPADAAARPGARRPGPRGRRRDHGPPRRDGARASDPAAGLRHGLTPGRSPARATLVGVPDLDKPPWRDIATFVRTDVLPLLLIVVVAIIALRIARIFVHGLVKTLLDRETTEGTAQELSAVEVAKRMDTLDTLLGSAVRFFILVVAGLMIMGRLGLDIGPAVAGLGVVGIAVGFGAQFLVRDYLNGALILIENQYAKGDVVRIGGVAGTVEDFTLRRTTLRDLDGSSTPCPTAR